MLSKKYLALHEEYVKNKSAINVFILSSLVQLGIDVGSAVIRGDTVGIVKKIGLPLCESLPPFYHVRVHWKFKTNPSKTGYIKISHTEWIGFEEVLTFKLQESIND